MKFRFSIRDLLWLTALVAVLVAWWLDHRRLTPHTLESFDPKFNPVIMGGIESVTIIPVDHDRPADEFLKPPADDPPPDDEDDADDPAPKSEGGFGGNGGFGGGGF